MTEMALNVTSSPEIDELISKCNAEFDKKLIKAVNDPYGIFQKYANQTLPLEKRKEIALSRMRSKLRYGSRTPFTKTYSAT